MRKQMWLISWIGKADHNASEGRSGGDAGPVATALLGQKRYDRIYLLTNYEFEHGRQFCTWVEGICGYPDSAVDLFAIDLRSPIDYAAIYTGVSENLKAAHLPRD